MIDTRPAPTTATARAAGRFDSRRARRVGLVLTGVGGLFLLFDAVIHILRLPVVTASFADLGYPVTVALGIGVLELGCLVLYLVPRTSVLGAVLLTGYLGGAVSAQLRVDAPVFSTLLFPVYLGVIVWGGVFLRDARLRALFPLRARVERDTPTEARKY